MKWIFLTSKYSDLDDLYRTEQTYYFAKIDSGKTEYSKIVKNYHTQKNAEFKQDDFGRPANGKINKAILQDCDSNFAIWDSLLHKDTYVNVMDYATSITEEEAIREKVALKYVVLTKDAKAVVTDKPAGIEGDDTIWFNPNANTTCNNSFVAIRDAPYLMEVYKFSGDTADNEKLAKKITAVIHGILHPDNYKIFYEEALPWLKRNTNLTKSDLADIYHDMLEASLSSDYYLDRIESASAVVMIYNYNSYHAIPIVRNKNTDTVGYLETGGGLIWHEPGIWCSADEKEIIGEIPKGYLQQSKVKA